MKKKWIVALFAAVACVAISIAAFTSCDGNESTSQPQPSVHTHTYQNGVCTVCGERKPSENLAYALNSDGKSYSVTGIGTCTDTDLVIPSTYNGKPVTGIGKMAFAFYSSLTSVTIPDGVTSIGYGAFGMCVSLTSVTIPDRVALIGDYAFAGCDNLQYNEYSNGLYIGNNSNPYVLLVKAKSKDITECTIHSNTKFIHSDAFDECSSLIGVTIPDSVTSIGDYAFDECGSLEYNEYSNGLYLGNESNPYVLLVKAKSANITECTIHSKAKFIYSDAFYNCVSLTSVEIPDSVTSMGDWAFGYCVSLTSVEIPDSVTSMGDYAFGYCVSLTSVEIPDSVTSMGDYAFGECGNLQYNEYSNGLYLGNKTNPYVLLVKAKSEDITDCTVHSNTKFIHFSAFKDCSSLTSIAVDEDNIVYASYDGILCNKEKAEIVCAPMRIQGAIKIPEGVIAIGDGAFWGCSSLTSVTIPDGVIWIGSGAFGGCDALTSITIPEGVIAIGDGAFGGCKSLTSVTILGSVTYIGNEAFGGCDALTSITISEGVTWIGDGAFDEYNNLQYNEYSNGLYLGNTSNPYVLLVKAKSEDITECTIHSNTKCIYSYAFWGCSSLTSITIPDGVTSIGDYAFRNCSSLTSITIPDGVTSIGEGRSRIAVRLQA